MPSTTEERKTNATVKHWARKMQIAQANLYKAKGYTNVAAAKEMGISESSFRKILKETDNA